MEKLYTPWYKRLADKPNVLTDREWKDLVKFWTTEKLQVLSGRNIQSRSHQEILAHSV